MEHEENADENPCVDFNPAFGTDEEVATDLWSAAYREAVQSLGEDINFAILKGESIAELFEQLDNIDKEASQESAFLRGVRYLHSLQVPLEKFRLALDLATPLANVEPAGMVLGIVKGVTAVSQCFTRLSTVRAFLRHWGTRTVMQTIHSLRHVTYEPF